VHPLGVAPEPIAEPRALLQPIYLVTMNTGSPFEADMAGRRDLTQRHGELWYSSTDLTAALSRNSLPGGLAGLLVV
jgi:hypothetical protein